MPSLCREADLCARKICQIVKTRPSEFALPSKRHDPMNWLPGPNPRGTEHSERTLKITLHSETASRTCTTS